MNLFVSVSADTKSVLHLQDRTRMKKNCEFQLWCKRDRKYLKKIKLLK